MHLPLFIYLYNGGKTEVLNLDEISGYIKETFKNIKIQLRDDFLANYLSGFSSREKEGSINNLAKKFAGIKVRKANSREEEFDPLPGEIEYERKRISDQKSRSFGILYDGLALMTIFSGLIPREEFNFEHCHIIFTNQLFGTWDENDKRWHARVSIYGFPSIISTSGIVEAPAKPREFYLKRRMGINVESLKEEFSGRFIDYEDPRLTEVMKGYVMQALFFMMTGDPFCEDKSCRLFNAHWQEEVIWAQLKGEYEFCSYHKKMLEDIKCGRR